MTMRSVLAFTAVAMTSIAASACATYPDALSDCTDVTVQQANQQGATGCTISFAGCPENGTGQIVCDGGSCKCSWSSDSSRQTQNEAREEFDVDACALSVSQLKRNGETAIICEGVGA
jgi:hypothetical protein